MQEEEEEDDMFGGLQVGVATGNGGAPTEQHEADIIKECELELKRYLDTEGLSIGLEGGGYRNPLKWWKDFGTRQFPILWKLAEVFLAIPATSAPSERIWSRASQVLTIRRANLDEEITSGIMFVKENKQVLRSYWKEVTKGMENPIPVEHCGIPVVSDSEGEEEIEFGQNQ